MISFQETRRLFGPVNRPARNTNICHRAILRKALELFSEQELLAVFTEPIRLTVVMGSALTSNQLGKITTHYRSGLTSAQQHNGHLVARETDTPELEARVALRAYRDAYDLYFMCRRNDYTICNAQALPVLQAAEQAWHDWIVSYLAARDRPTRLDWALQPPTRPRAHSAEAACSGVSSRTSGARAAVGSRLRPIELVDSDEEAPRLPEQKTFLGVVDISDSEEEDAHPRKKRRV
ncbi:hypothetical protein DFH09DRAFT_1108133 [Mycena vulgaris]|nr:hypothetical protein DFH09DRAFT_1108133 [Mycena vulgaris]